MLLFVCLFVCLSHSLLVEHAGTGVLRGYNSARFLSLNSKRSSTELSVMINVWERVSSLTWQRTQHGNYSKYCDIISRQ